MSASDIGIISFASVVLGTLDVAGWTKLHEGAQEKASGVLRTFQGFEWLLRGLRMREQEPRAHGVLECCMHQLHTEALRF